MPVDRMLVSAVGEQTASRAPGGVFTSLMVTEKSPMSTPLKNSLNPTICVHDGEATLSLLPPAEYVRSAAFAIHFVLVYVLANWIHRAVAAVTLIVAVARISAPCVPVTGDVTRTYT